MKKYTIEEVLQEFNPFISLLKGRKKELKDGEYKEEEINYYPGFKEVVVQYERILTHSQEGYFPKELFENRSPNQTDEELAWIRKNYKQITLPVYLDWMNTLGRAWHNSNWSIQFQEEDKKYEGQYFRDYIENELPLYGDYLTFTTQIHPYIKTQDPVGVEVVKPYEYEYKENDKGEKYLDDQVLLNPTSFYYPCKQVLKYEEDSICIIETGEKSLVEYMGKPQNKGYIFEVHTVDSIYKIYQVGKYVDYTFQIELELNHNWGQMLANRLGGIPKLINNKLFYESPFIYAVDNLDLALLDNSNLMASKAKCVYPVRVMVGSECDFVANNGNRCNDGKIGSDTDGVYKESTCPKCMGSGLKNRISPMGELLWSPDGMQDKQVSGTEILRYVSPEIHTLEFLDKQIDKFMDRAYSMLHMSTTTDKANVNAPTATLTNVENKALMASIKMQSDQQFDALEWRLAAYGYLRYGTDYKAPLIIRPVTFDFTTEKDYLELLKFARESGASPVIIRQILIKYITSIYFTNSNSEDAFTLLLSVDTIIEKTSEEIDIMIARNEIYIWQSIIHNSGINIIQDLFTLNPNFFEQPFETQKEQVIEEAKKMEPETINPVTNVLNG